MLSPDYLAGCTDDISALYERYQSSVIENMAARVARMGSAGISTLDQTRCLQESGLLFDDILTEIAVLNNSSQRELRRLFDEAGAKTLVFDDRIYRQMGLTPIPINQSPSMLNTLLAGLEKTKGALGNLTMTTATITQTQFISALNLTYMQVSSGAMGYTQAIRAAIESLSKQGITSVRYDKNKSASYHKIDVATRRAVLTGVNQTAAQLQMMRADEMGCDLVEVTAHNGARPDHAEWQGQIYSRSGKGDYPDFESTTGYGTGDGLCGWNCRHNFSPYFDGLSRPAYSREELSEMDSKTVRYNDKDLPLYEATQTQRNMERKVRALKRELSALNAATLSSKDEALCRSLKNDFDLVSVTLKEKECVLKDFTRGTGLPRQREREQVVGFGRSPAQRAVWANRRRVSP